MTEHRFAAPPNLRVYVEIPSGSIRVDASDQDEPEPTARVTVSGPDADEVEVVLEGPELRVVAPRRSGFHLARQGYQVAVEVPAGTDLATRTGSADLVAVGALGAVSLRSGSGDVDLAEITGPGRIAVGSGAVRLDETHDQLGVKSGSGRVELGRVSGEVRVSTGSGDVVVGTVRRGRVTVKGATGEVQLGVPAGVPVWTDLSTITGRVSSTVQGTGAPAEGQDHVELHATTVSGDITLSAR